ncbi:phospholipid scramblase 1-like [Anopheles coustani]|uniref:phospholipid scramblase 1-like n=1 Tax=Anopheles coustani TaxID=139045 RepID=UPI00265B083D|nr:phospholipid scramblase 1-like [Anopheles coustani]
MSTSPKEVSLEENKLPPGGIHQDPSIEGDPLAQPTSPVPQSAPVTDGMSLPITTQPGTQTQLGLENLYGAGKLVVNLETIEKRRSDMVVNKYMIKSSLGGVVYCAEEKSSSCARYWCGPGRQLDIRVQDIFQNEVLLIQRDSDCSNCCCTCDLHKVEVLLTSGTVIGTIEQRKTLFHPEFNIKNQHGQTVLMVRHTTPFGTCKLTGDVIFHIFGMDGTEIGKLSKKYDACHSFSITFPMDLDVMVKATLLGALFWLHYMLSEVEHGKPRQIRPLCM